MKHHKRLLLILALGGVLAVISHLHGPAAAQRRGMRAAAAHRDRLIPRLAAEPRFNQVRLDVTTHPGLLVRGAVSDQRALDDLERLVAIPDDLGFHVMMRAVVAPSVTTEPSDK